MSDQTVTSTNQNIHESVNKINVIYSLYKEYPPPKKKLIKKQINPYAS
jgi:hypothetical protein